MMRRSVWIGLGVLTILAMGCFISFIFISDQAREEDLPPKIFVNIPDLSAWWIGQPPILKVEATDDKDTPRVFAWLNGKPIDATASLPIDKDGVYFLKVLAEDSMEHRSRHSVIFEVLPVPKYKMEVEVLWMDYVINTNKKTANVETLLLIHKPDIFPRMVIDGTDPRLQRAEICRVAPTSWSLLLTNSDGAIVSDPIPLYPGDPGPSERAFCNCLENVAVLHFKGKVRLGEEPTGFIVLGAGIDSKGSESELGFFIETLPVSLTKKTNRSIESILYDFRTSGRFSPCPPGRSPNPTDPGSCRRKCVWQPRIQRTPNHCTEYFFNWSCPPRICEYHKDGFAGSYIEGEATARDNCGGCVADADCFVMGRVQAALVHMNICPPCRWQVVNAISAPRFTCKVEISSSYGFGGDNAAVAAGLIHVYVNGGSCEFAATALGGCQVGYQNPFNVNFSVSGGPGGRQTGFKLSLTWSGSNSDSCGSIGNGVCSETPGTSIRAQITTGLKLKARSNGGIGNFAPVWAKARVFDSAPDTIIGGRCENAVKNLKIW